MDAPWVEAGFLCGMCRDEEEGVALVDEGEDMG
jgi:hypothetical protein